jgi:hypothetical protein
MARFAFAELGEKPPALDPPGRFDNALRELMALSRKIAGRMEYLHAGYGPLTKRGRKPSDASALRRRLGWE